MFHITMVCRLLTMKRSDHRNDIGDKVQGQIYLKICLTAVMRTPVSCVGQWCLYLEQ